MDYRIGKPGSPDFSCGMTLIRCAAKSQPSQQQRSPPARRRAPAKLSSAQANCAASARPDGIPRSATCRRAVHPVAGNRGSGEAAAPGSGVRRYGADHTGVPPECFHWASSADRKRFALFGRPPDALASVPWRDRGFALSVLTATQHCPVGRQKKRGISPLGCPVSHSCWSYFLPLTAALSFAPAANFAVLAAGILIAAPV